MNVKDEGLSGLKCGKQEDLVSTHSYAVNHIKIVGRGRISRYLPLS